MRNEEAPMHTMQQAITGLVFSLGFSIYLWIWGITRLRDSSLMHNPYITDWPRLHLTEIIHGSDARTRLERALTSAKRVRSLALRSIAAAMVLTVAAVVFLVVVLLSP
jgi:hypothetical protein